jgi:hypothetical protein
VLAPPVDVGLGRGAQYRRPLCQVIIGRDSDEDSGSAMAAGCGLKQLHAREANHAEPQSKRLQLSFPLGTKTQCEPSPRRCLHSGSSFLLRCEGVILEVARRTRPRTHRSHTARHRMRERMRTLVLWETTTRALRVRVAKRGTLEQVTAVNIGAVHMDAVIRPQTPPHRER